MSAHVNNGTYLYSYLNNGVNLTMLRFSTMVHISTIVEKNTNLAEKSMSYISELDLIRKVGTDIESSSQKFLIMVEKNNYFK